MKLFSYSLLTVALVALLHQAASAQQKGGSSPSGKKTEAASQAKISLQEARKIALANAQGEIINEKLDKLADNVCYSFDIKDSDTVKEVLVDSVTGRVVIVELGPSTTPSTPHLKMPSLRPH
jgi:uncharacterized membrane protein YkoI